MHWNETNTTEAFACSHSEGGLKRAYGLCQRMMHFFHQYLLYVTFEVLEPHWLTLLRQLAAAETLDKVLNPPWLYPSMC